MSSTAKNVDRVGSHWNQRVTVDRPVRWMNHPWVIDKVNQLVGNINSPVWGAGLLERLKTNYPDRLPFERGISVACGNGLIELDLVKSGIVKSFDCYDFAEERLEHGRKRARAEGLEHAVKYYKRDAFRDVAGNGEYDFVHWRNAIHHMLDTRQAIEWSSACLAPGGILYLDDYVGANRFQYSDTEIACFNALRGSLPLRYFKRGENKAKPKYRRLKRAIPREVIAVDPSEAADSANIIPSLMAVFPKADVVKVSGGVFQAGLHDIMGNFDAKRDNALLNMLWGCEQTMILNGHLHWACALAEKT